MNSDTLRPSNVQILDWLWYLHSSRLITDLRESIIKFLQLMCIITRKPHIYYENHLAFSEVESKGSSRNSD